MLTSDFSYQLPPEAIAQYPVPRGESRLLVLERDDPWRHLHVTDLPALFEPADLLVANDTRVLPARLFGRRRETDGRLELLLATKVSERTWDVLAKPGRRARPGATLDFDDGLEARVLQKTSEGRYRVEFTEPVEGHLDCIGHVPLPPYIRRPDEASDRSHYQTVFARHPGAIAAPTAGLHFSGELLQQLDEKGIELVTITLHVGVGTFKPVTAELVHEHRMDPESYSISAEAAGTIRRTRAAGGRIVAVGTTVVRALEASARSGNGEVVAGDRSTDLFISPGFGFQVVDVLLTNFHLPCSTLLMLVCAFAGREKVLAAYQEAIREGYRFYSYGDAMLAERARD